MNINPLAVDVLSESKSLYATSKGLKFDGNPELWVYFEAMWLTEAETLGFADLVYGDVLCPKKSEINGDKAKEAIWQKNNLGYARLLGSMLYTTDLGQVAFDIVNGAKNADYERGNLKLAWNKLQCKYRDSAVTSALGVKKEFSECKLKAGVSPDVWVTKKTEIQRRFNKTIEQAAKINANSIVTKLSKITDDDMLADIIICLPREYDSTVTRLEKEFDEGTLTVQEAQNLLMARFKREQAYEENEDNSHEATLTAVVSTLESMNNDEVAAVFKSVFKGNCRKCGKRGHKASECRSGNGQGGGRGGRRQAGGRTFRGKCNKCGKPGHYARDCPESKHEAAHQAVDEDDEDDEDISDEEELGFLMLDDDEEYEPSECAEDTISELADAYDSDDEGGSNMCSLPRENDTSKSAEDVTDKGVSEHEYEGGSNVCSLLKEIELYESEAYAIDQGINEHDETEGGSNECSLLHDYDSSERADDATGKRASEPLRLWDFSSSDDDSDGSYASMPSLVARHDVDSDSSDDESEGSSCADLPALVFRSEEVSSDEESDDDSSISDINELVDASEYSISYHDDVMTLFTDATHATTRMSFHAPARLASSRVRFPMSYDAIEDDSEEESLHELRSVSTTSTVRSDDSSVTSIAVTDDKITFPSKEEAQLYANGLSENRLEILARNYGWKWMITPDVLELIRFTVTQDAVTPNYIRKSDLDTYECERERLRRHVVSRAERDSHMLKLRDFTPTFEVANPIHAWIWNHLSDLQDSPECLTEDYFFYWADRLGHLYHESINFTDENDPGLAKALWESVYGDEPLPDAPDAFKWKERLHQESDLLALCRHQVDPLEPHDVHTASTTCISGEDDAADGLADEIPSNAGESTLVTVDEDELSDSEVDEEIAAPCIIDGKRYPGFTENTAVGDTGSSTHLWNDDKHLYNVEKLYGERANGIGSTALTVKGDMPVIIKPVVGKPVRTTLHGVKVSPTSKFKLLSITAALSKGATLSSDANNNITLTNGKTVIKFDRRIRTKGGSIQGVEILPDLPRLRQLREQENECVLHMRDVRPSKQNYDIQKLHRQLGHPSIATTRSTAKARGWQLTGTITTCQDCAMAKVRQRNVSKKPADYGELQAGEMMSLDISSPGESIGGSKHFCLMQCMSTDKTFYYFLKAKSHMPKKVIADIKQLKRKYGITVRTIRCDGAGENKTLQKLCEEEGLDIDFQITAPNTGQHNPVERKIATCYTNIRAMKNDAGLSKEEFKLVWTHAMALLIQMMNEMVKPGQTKSPNQLFYGDDVSIPSILADGPPNNTFGDVCVCADRNKHKSKFQDRGKLAIWLGPVMNSSTSNHYLYSLSTKRIIQSRDVIFLNKSYSSWKTEQALKQAQRNELRAIDNVMIPTTEDDDEDDDIMAHRPTSNYVSDDESIPPSPSNDESFETANDEMSTSMSEGTTPPSPPPVPTPPVNTTTRLYRELQKLNASYNPTIPAVASTGRTDAQDTESTDTESSANNAEPTTNVESGRTDQDGDFVMIDDEGSDIALLMHDRDFRELFNVTTDSNGTPTSTPEPTNFYDAWNHPNPRERKLWREAIRKEFKDYADRDCFKIVKKSSVPKERRRIKCKWVYKVKRCGRHRARLCACGYSQIPGVDFDQFTSPVLNDISLRVMILLLMMNPKFIHRVCDVETAFLYGRMKEQIYMDLPPGYEEVANANRDEDCVLLLSSIYGTVQAALMYFELWQKTLRKLGFMGGNVDPCLFYRVDKLGTVFIAVYVDDNLIIGDEAAVMQVISSLKKSGFVLKTDETLNDYLSCRITFNSDRSKCIVHQPHLLAKLKATFGDMVSSTNFVTPGTPNQYITSEQDADNVLSPKEHADYRSMIGLLNYLVKLTRPDIANAVRNLGKGLAAPGPLAKKEGLRVTKFVLDTQEYGLLMRVDRSSRNSGKWTLVVYSDSDHAGDPESRRSISGFVLFLNGVPICYRSKAQATVSLSSSEAEWIALSEAVKEIVFVVQLLRDIGLKVETPVIVKVDNIGAIHMSQNVTPSARTRHIDIRTKFVREYNSGTDPLIKIVFCKSEDNVSDICTKNLPRELHEKHSKALVGKVDWDKWTCK